MSLHFAKTTLLPAALAIASAVLLPTPQAAGNQEKKNTLAPLVEPPGTQTPSARWKFGGIPSQKAAIEWSGERGGWKFDPRLGYQFAYAEWPIGTSPFTISWDIEIDGGNSDVWPRWFGGFVGLSSALPGDMTPGDLAAWMTFNREGIGAQLTTSGLFSPNTAERKSPSYGKDKPYVRFLDHDVATRYVLNGYGQKSSIAWPGFFLEKSRYSFRMERTAEGLMKYDIWRVLADGIRIPWHSRSWDLNAPNATKKPVSDIGLKYLIVGTSRNEAPSYNPESTMDFENGKPQVTKEYVWGVVLNLQAFSEGQKPPSIEQLKPATPTISKATKVTVTGSGFQKGARVVIANKSVESEFVSGNEVTFKAPELPAGSSYPLSVVNTDGLSASFPRGIAYGNLITDASPYEAGGAGGDLVTLRGGGFSKETKMTVGGQPAAIVEVNSPSEIRIRVPAGTPGMAKIAASNGPEVFAGEPRFGYAPHPYLLCDSKKLDRLRTRFNDPAMGHYKSLIMKMADRALTRELPFSKIASGPAGQGIADIASATVTGLSWGYALTGDKKYFDRLMIAAEELSNTPNTLDFHAMVVQAMAIAYDLTFQDLSPEQKVFFQRYMDFTFDDYISRANANLWFLGNISNTNAVANAGGMMPGLATRFSRDETIVKYAKGAAGRVLNYSNSAFTKDGACVEGTLYWEYGLTNMLTLGTAMKNALGDDFGLLTAPNILKGGDYARAILAGDGTFIPVNDSQPWLNTMAVLCWLDSQKSDPLLRWLADLGMSGELPSGMPVSPRYPELAFLWRSEEPTPKTFPGVPEIAVLDAVMQGILRSDTSAEPALVIGLKGRDGGMTHHLQPDQGSITAYGNGEAYLIDPGYYQPAATVHTLPLVDGRGPDRKSVAKISDFGQSGSLKWALIDSTAAYNQKDCEDKTEKKPNLNRVNRWVVLSGNQTVILDDIEGSTPVEATAQYQAGWKAECAPDGRSAIINGKKGSLSIQTFGPEIKLAAEGPKPFGQSWFYKRLAEAGKVEWFKVAGNYAADPANPLITILTSSKERPTTPEAKVVRNQDSIEVELGGGTKITFARVDGVWKFLTQQ